MFWVWLPLLGPIRWTTLVAFMACLAIGSYRFGLLRGGLAAMAGISTFELVFSATGTLVHAWPLAPLVWLWAGLIAWPLLALRENIKPSGELLVAFVLVWFAWIAQGFSYNVPTHDARNVNGLAELLNALSKSLMIMAWALPSLGWIARSRTRRHGSLGTPKEVGSSRPPP
jgi:hypothetical protein